MKSFLFVNLIIVTARNHLSQHLAKAIQTNWNPPIGKNNMVKNTPTKQNNHKTGGNYNILKDGKDQEIPIFSGQKPCTRVL